MDEQELIELLRQAARLSHRELEEAGRPLSGIVAPRDDEEARSTPETAGPHRERERVLSLLDESEGVSQRRLALILGIRPQSLSELLGKLERSGLLQREKNPQDRREVLVSLTPAGRERAAAFETERRRAGESFLSPLTEAERRALGELLEKLTVGREEPETEGEACP